MPALPVTESPLLSTPGESRRPLLSARGLVRHFPLKKSALGRGGGVVHFVPGFPVMAWPMIENLLDQDYRSLHRHGAWREHSVVVKGAMEAALTPLMEAIERQHPVKVFSLPSVDHPEHGRHIELGVKGEPSAVAVAFADLMLGLRHAGAELGPEMVR